MGKVIHWELLKSDHSNKWYMRNPESVLENETHKLLWDFEIQTNYQISARRPDLIIINEKENYQNWVKLKELKLKSEINTSTFCLGIEKAMEHESDGYNNCN